MYNRAVLAHWKELGVMPSLEERVAYLEGRFSEHMQTVGALRDDLGLLRTDMNRRFEELHDDMNRRFEQVDKRFEQIDRRLEQIDRRFDGIETKFEGRFNSFEDKSDRRFHWLFGIQMGGFIALFSAMISLY